MKSNSIASLLAGIKKKSVKLNFKCEHCGKSYHNERTLINHVCEKKRRFLSKNTKHVRLGFMAFSQFFAESYPTQKPKTMHDFINSSHYTLFVKFGSYLSNNMIIDKEQFISHLIKKQIKLTSWCSDSVYEQYILEKVLTETAESGIFRTIETMIQWGDSNSDDWNLYFKKIHPNKAVKDIRDGLISPWLLLNAKSGRELLTKLSDEQLCLIESFINPSYWKTKFNSCDAELAKTVIKEAQI